MKNEVVPVKAEAAPLATQETTPMVLLERMVASGASPETMREMMELARDWKRMTDEQAFSERMAQFRRRCPVIVKNHAVTTRSGEHMYDTISLVDIQTKIDPIIAECGLTYDLDYSIEGGIIKATCRVRYGAYCRESCGLGREPEALRQINESQRLGWAQTYAGKRALCAAFGLRIVEPETGPVPPGLDDATSVDCITPDQATILRDLLYESGTLAHKFLTWLSKECGQAIATVDDIPRNAYAKAEAALKQKVKAGK